MTEQLPEHDPNEGIDTTWDHDAATGQWEQVGTFNPDEEAPAGGAAS